MALITRLSRLLTADFHALLDRLEEPDILVNQAIREMELDLVQRRHALKELTLRRDQLAKKSNQIDQSLTSIQEEIALCLETDNEALAKGLVRRKLEGQAFCQRAGLQIEQWNTSSKEQMASIQEDELQLESLRQRAEVMEQPCTDQPLSEENLVATGVSDHDIEVAFLKEKQQRTQSRGDKS